MGGAGQSMLLIGSCPWRICSPQVVYLLILERITICAGVLSPLHGGAMRVEHRGEEDHLSWGERRARDGESGLLMGAIASSRGA